MKWDVKHDRAKKVLNHFLDNAGYWTEIESLTEGLTEDEIQEVSTEVATMIQSITKRYKLDVVLPAEPVVKEEPAAEEGFVLHLEGTWCEISNKYAVLESGDVAVNEEDIPAGFAEKKLDRYIETHKIRGYGKVDGCVKRVACDERTKEYIQLQAVKLDDDTYMVQEFDNELVFMGELWSGCKYPDEVIDWMKSNYEIESCLTAEVYRSSLGDCTNNGISSYARELYILDTQKGPFEPDDIRQCVYIEKREVMGQEYVDCKPAYCRKRWYMAGGNILYTSDSRFKQITGISYPIAIHDRYEGR